MKKKSDQLSVISEPPAGTSQEAVIPLRGLQEWTVGEWCGHPQFRCVYCEFDALDDVENIKAHIEEAHRAKPITEPSPTKEEAEEAKEEDGVFELELKEVDSNVDEDGNVHKTFTIKE